MGPRPLSSVGPLFSYFVVDKQKKRCFSFFHVRIIVRMSAVNLSSNYPGGPLPALGPKPGLSGSGVSRPRPSRHRPIQFFKGLPSLLARKFILKKEY